MKFMLKIINLLIKIFCSKRNIKLVIENVILMYVVRYVRWFEKKGEEFIGEEEIKLNLDLLQKEFNVKKENPMYDCWKIEEKNIKLFKNILKHKIDINKFDYFVEADICE